MKRIKIKTLKDAEDAINAIHEKIESQLEVKLDENTLALQSLEIVMRNGFGMLQEEVQSLDKRLTTLDKRLTTLDKRLTTLESTVQGGFDNIGTILQEISNKLD